MDFSSQSLAATSHHDIGKVTISNVTVDGSFTNAQCLSRFLNREQPLVIVRSNQFLSPKCRSRPMRGGLVGANLRQIVMGRFKAYVGPVGCILPRFPLDMRRGAIIR
jgi:hypothetical protein